MHEVILLEHEFLSIDIPCLTAAVNLVFELLLLIHITSGDIIEKWIQILAQDCNRIWVCNLVYLLWNWSIQILEESDETTLLTYFLNNFEFKVIFLERKYVSCLTNLPVLTYFGTTRLLHVGALSSIMIKAGQFSKASAVQVHPVRRCLAKQNACLRGLKWWMEGRKVIMKF